ncbi:uncharacterized protein LOC142880437 isoform X2 [Nelusetta ayraudi]|uniref:uncharacterized protein LOC142880437 isoform X2 n=1 Tax=Nelusetta ayraudi TaxID=303726 RepID=UPI003F713023
MSTSHEDFPVGGESGSAMLLPLHSEEDHNGNAFPVSSSSSSASSSCSSSRMGESSPESLRSLSSLSGGRTRSPLDYDMLEVTAVSTVETPQEKTSAADEDLAGRTQTTAETTESNDNSVSVYLDANSEYHRELWNDNDSRTLALSLDTSGSGDVCARRPDSSCPDSDATEIPGDDDDDEEEEEDEEVLFLSVSSDVGLCKSSVALARSAGEAGFSSAAIAVDEGSEVVLAQVEVPSEADHRSEALAFDDHAEVIDVYTPSPGPPTAAPPPPLEGAITGDEGSEVVLAETQVPSVADHRPEALATDGHVKVMDMSAPSPGPTGVPPPPRESESLTGQQDGASKPEFAPASLPPKAVKTSNQEARKNSQQDPKLVHCKGGLRLTPSPSKTPTQNKSVPANGRRAPQRRKDAELEVKLSAGAVKVAIVHKAIRGRRAGARANQKAAAIDSSQHETKRATMSGTLSTSASSLGSEPAEESILDSSRNPVRKRPDQRRADESPDRRSSNGDQSQCAGKALPSDAAAGKARNPKRRVSSKLGPNARQQSRGPRQDKGPAGLAAAPGSGLPGRRSPGPRQAPGEGSTSRDDGQSGGGGSPTRAKQSLTQSHGIPKLRPATERLPAQQPPSGSVARPAASKLPVKGLPTILSVSTPGSNENNGTASRAKADEAPSGSALPVGSQVTVKAPPCGSTSAFADVAPGAAASRPSGLRSRALSVQSRAATSNLKSPTVTSQNMTKPTSATQPAAKATPTASQLARQAPQYPLQRSGSARFSRIHTAVDKNKPREVSTRTTGSSGSSSLGTNSPAGGTNQNVQQQQQQQPPPPVERIPEAPAKASETLVPPAPSADPTPTSTGTSGGPCTGSKTRTGSRSSPRTGSRLQNASKSGSASAVAADRTGPAKPSQSKEQAEKRNQAISQLRRLLVQGNRRVEALATVIQHLFTEREEALKQRKELSLEVANLRGELVTSKQSCTDLQKEKEEVCTGAEDALKTLKERHKEELVQLEDSLRSFYQTEWDKVHQTYQEEADKYRAVMEQQVKELITHQEAERKNQEMSHSEKMESLKLQYETSVEEMKRTQQTDLQNLERTLQETETTLSDKVSELSAEKEALNEKLKAEEERRKQILDKSLKDSHTLYLEQELESLKVVLEIKTNQLHQKEKKLMEMDKLVETNVKLEECLNKVQQENEDYKARMDKHAALSRQLSTEQAKLQQTLQKESKVNKRLSMENEELLWKLHNGDLLASPRRVSPTSPFGSPRNSASFPAAAPLSPR